MQHHSGRNLSLEIVLPVTSISFCSHLPQSTIMCEDNCHHEEKLSSNYFRSAPVISEKHKSLCGCEKKPTKNHRKVKTVSICHMKNINQDSTSPISTALEKNNSEYHITPIKSNGLKNCNEKNEAKKLYCPVCSDELNESNIFKLLSCEHTCCISCLALHILYNHHDCTSRYTRCVKCDEIVHISDVTDILNRSYSSPFYDQLKTYFPEINKDHIEQIVNKYEERMLTKALCEIPGICFCPAPDCNYAAIADTTASQKCPMVKCQSESCGSYFCCKCKCIWHNGMTCKEYQAKYLEETFEIASRLTNNNDSHGKHENIKFCPGCSSPISKTDDGSCNHMKCTICLKSFCWLCLREVTDMHFLQPSGCTFWGSKPWSNKKRIIAQISILAGAPLLVIAASTLAIPVVLFGSPVYVYIRIDEIATEKKWSSLRKISSLITATSLTIILSPLLILGTLAIVIPTCLIYMYCFIIKEIAPRIKFTKRKNKELEFSPKNEI